MLLDKCLYYYDSKFNLNCAETILYAANDEYSLGLDKKALKLAAGFGGGMAVEGVCGAASGAIMALGCIFVEDRAHESDRIKNLTKEFLGRFNERLCTVDCKELKDMYKTEDKRCSDMIIVAGEILDDIVGRERIIAAAGVL